MEFPFRLSIPCGRGLAQLFNLNQVPVRLETLTMPLNKL